MTRALRGSSTPHLNVRTIDENDKDHRHNVANSLFPWLFYHGAKFKMARVVVSRRGHTSISLAAS